MATKYHISDNGMPGKCGAATPESCPKTQAGDSFHGTLEEASQESQQRFEKQLGAFVTSTKKAEEKAETPKAEGYTAVRFENYTAAELRRELEMWDTENPADDPTDLEMALVAAEAREAAEEEIYVHRQGKIIRVNKDGSVEAFTPDGKRASTSATAEKLREGYGGWKRAESGSANLPDAPKAAITPEQEDELVEHYDSYDHSIRVVEDELKDLYARHRAYNSANAAAEGRAYYMGRRPDGTFGRVEGVNPQGQTYFTPSEVQASEVKQAQATVANMREAAAKAQTALEENGLGHRIPDEGNTVRVRTQAQKWLLEDELKGQISDGKWENSGGEAWQEWSSAKVVVDPKNAGRNFNTTKDNYQLNAKDLLDVVGDRMVANVQAKTGKTDYDEKAMRADLKDLRDIFKTKRGGVTGD